MPAPRRSLQAQGGPGAGAAGRAVGVGIVLPVGMLEPLLFQLRALGVPVGVQEWLALHDALGRGLVAGFDELHLVGRAVCVHSEAHYDAWEQALALVFGGVAADRLDPALREAIEDWLRDPATWEAARGVGERTFGSLEELLDAFQKTLEAQQGRHQGGNRWVGTGGSSPWGANGRAEQGVALGAGGGSRSGIRLPDSQTWRDYREDRTLDTRDLEQALKALRQLVREGEAVLDVDDTIAATARNAGEIELAFRPQRINRIHVVLVLDSGGSMDPHHQVVTRLFTAAKQATWFKSLTVYHFHNCVYRWLTTDYGQRERVATERVLAELTPRHRVIFVGDASMAPWELFGGVGTGQSGLDWLRRFAETTPARIWLNPDPQRYWQHTTVRAIGQVHPMFPLTLQGLRDGVRRLRTPS